MRGLAFRIAKEVGGMTVDELLHRMSASEMVEWDIVFEQWYPSE